MQTEAAVISAAEAMHRYLIVVACTVRAGVPAWSDVIMLSLECGGRIQPAQAHRRFCWAWDLPTIKNSSTGSHN
jgi:hypothetical protein